jgi:hypothetical protein
LHFATIDEEATTPEVVPSEPVRRYVVAHDGSRLVQDGLLREGMSEPMAHIHVVVIV